MIFCILLIYHGDSLSPFLLCIALISLTNFLYKNSLSNQTELPTKINHLPFKVFTGTEKGMVLALKLVETFSEDIENTEGILKRS